MTEEKCKKLKVLFVGAFTQARDGAVGGQLYACSTLLNSEIVDYVDFTLIDSTMESLPPPGLLRRSYLALKRLFRFFYLLIFYSFDTAFIFTSAGFSFMEKGAMVIVARMFNVRVVFSPRSGLLLDDINKKGFMHRYIKVVLRKCDVILCQSNNWKDIYQNLTQLPSSRFSIVENWMDPAPYLKLPIHKKDEKSVVNILFLGWIEKNKGIYELVAAAHKYHNLLYNVRFIICGKGSELSTVMDLVSRHGLEEIFEFRGWVKSEEKIAALSDADILIMPSYKEGLPNSLLEAMASGRSVIASSVGAIPDVIDHGQNGFLIEKVDTDEIAKSLLFLASSPERRVELSVNARESIKARHDISFVWKNVFNLLSDK